MCYLITTKKFIAPFSCYFIFLGFCFLSHIFSLEILFSFPRALLIIRKLLQPNWFQFFLASFSYEFQVYYQCQSHQFISLLMLIKFLFEVFFFWRLVLFNLFFQLCHFSCFVAMHYYTLVSKLINILHLYFFLLFNHFKIAKSKEPEIYQNFQANIFFCILGF